MKKDTEIIEEEDPASYKLPEDTKVVYDKSVTEVKDMSKYIYIGVLFALLIIPVEKYSELFEPYTHGIAVILWAISLAMVGIGNS